jgi:hypothetical protein
VPGRGCISPGAARSSGPAIGIVSGDDLKLISRNGHDRTALFRAPFDGMTPAGRLPDEGTLSV